MKPTKTLRYILSKGVNKRIEIQLLEDKEGNHAFMVHTKTLVDFKTRKILRTDNIYSVETFALLNSFMGRMMEDSEVANKIIHKEVAKIIPFKAWSNLSKM